MRAWRLLVLCLAVLMSATCARYPKPTIRVDESSSAGALRIRIDGREAPRIITFERVPEPGAAGSVRSTWHLLRRSDTSVTTPVQITYGTVPDGYRAMQPPDSLVAASYRIYAKLTHAGAGRYFIVAPDGRVTTVKRLTRNTSTRDAPR